jgi:hypothetical protein
VVMLRSNSFPPLLFLRSDWRGDWSRVTYGHEELYNNTVLDSTLNSSLRCGLGWAYCYYIMQGEKGQSSLVIPSPLFAYSELLGLSYMHRSVRSVCIRCYITEKDDVE